MNRLSRGAIVAIHNGEQPENVTLQIMVVRKFPAGDRCRLMVSDGQHSSGFAILASQMSEMVEKGELQPHTVVEIIRYYCNDMAGKKKVMIVLDLKVVMTAEQAGGPLGNPIAFDGSAPSATSTQMSQARTPLVARNEPNVSRISSSTGPVMAPNGMPNVRPISTLTPYQNKWTICARVTTKSSIKTWSNSRGDGKLFSIELIDESGEIRATAFNQECDKFYEMIEPNTVYFLSGANLKTANKQYTTIKNDYEMTFNAGTQLMPCHEENDIPTMQFDFVSLDQVATAAKDTIIDLVGICQHANDLSSVTIKSSGRELNKRDITVVDHTSRSVNVTLWGEKAEQFVGDDFPVVAIKGAKVSDFSGVSLSLISSATLQINPDLPEAHQVKGWWDSTGSHSTDIVSLTTGRGSGGGGINPNEAYKTFEEAKRAGLGSQATADYYTCKATVVLVKKENVVYTACPSEGCNKKVTDMSNGMYRCEKCNQEFDRFSYRMMVQANVADFTTNQWISGFQEAGETMLGMTADEVGKAKDDPNSNDFSKTMVKANFKEYIFRMRVRMETFNDESRLKTTIASVAPMNYVEYNKRLVGEIKAMNAIKA